MSASKYRQQIGEVLTAIWTTQSVRIEQAAQMMAASIEKGGLVHLFGSGHSVLPVLDIFPRYGSYAGFSSADGRSPHVVERSGFGRREGVAMAGATRRVRSHTI